MSSSTSTTSTSASKSILVVGISEPPSTAPSALREKGVSAEFIRQSTIATVQAAAAKGFSLQPVLLSPSDLPKGVQDFEQTLQLKAWDGVMIGFGVRGDPQFTEVFEKLVELVRVRRPEARMLFNTEPKDVLETVLRTFKEGAEA